MAVREGVGLVFQKTVFLSSFECRHPGKSPGPSQAEANTRLRFALAARHCSSDVIEAVFVAEEQRLPLASSLNPSTLTKKEEKQVSENVRDQQQIRPKNQKKKNSTYKQHDNLWEKCK